MRKKATRRFGKRALVALLALSLSVMMVPAVAFGFGSMQTGDSVEFASVDDEAAEGGDAPETDKKDENAQDREQPGEQGLTVMTASTANANGSQQPEGEGSGVGDTLMQTQEVVKDGLGAPTITVTPPVAGATSNTAPVVTVPSGADYTINSSYTFWCDSGGNSLSSPITFKAGETYYLSTMLTPTAATGSKSYFRTSNVTCNGGGVVQSFYVSQTIDGAQRIVRLEPLVKVTAKPSSSVVTREKLEKSSTVYAGEIIVDGTSQLRYLYSTDITVSTTVFDNLKAALEGTGFQGMVPSPVNSSTAAQGYFRYAGSAQQGTDYNADIDYFGGISQDWSSASAVASRCFAGVAGTEANRSSSPFESVLSTTFGQEWILDGNDRKQVDTIVLHLENTTIVYTTFTACTHSRGTSIAEVPATCASDGVKAHWKCSDCGKLFTDSTHATETTLDALKVAALGHDWGEWAEADGKATRTCKRDASHTETVEISYSAVSGDGATWEKGLSDPLTFTFKRNVNDGKTFKSFKGAKVDGADVPESAIATAEGSLVLSMTTTYLESLSVGEHKLTVAFEDGEATAAFTVKAAETKAAAASASSKSSSPKTGDAMPVTLLAVSAALSAVVLFAARTRTRQPMRATGKHARR
ncbi:MAG: hypothetical protein IJ111_14280 [Eggerthellaceae bacterium]|nr:hypothetical protein [Eggerthellaceae bacterium]